MRMNYSKVEEYQQDLSNISQNIKNIFYDIEEDIKKINKGENWDGPASNTYIGRIKQLSTNFISVYNELDSLTTYLNSCVNRYKALDSKVKADVNRK